MERARFHIPGHPAPKGSRTTGIRKDGSRYTRESSKRAGPWVEAVATIAKAHRRGEQPLEPPYEIELIFALPRGQRPKYDWPTKDGDVDKLARAVLDGLVRGGLIVDDRHVTRCDARKGFAPDRLEGVTVAIL